MSVGPISDGASGRLEPEQHILVVDDHQEIRDLLGRFLRKHGFRVTTARDGYEMREALAAAGGGIDLIVLDLMLPGDDGLTLCRELRAASAIPVIMLTAMGEETDRIVGLEIGADDYMAKPFNPRELLARIKAVMRRTVLAAAVETPRSGGRIRRFAGWTVDLVRRELRSPAGVLVDLTSGEYDLLTAFVEHPQRVLTRDQLLDITRSRAATAAFDRAIDVQVSRLRRKIDGDSQTSMIKTVRGAGYVFTVPVERL